MSIKDLIGENDKLKVNTINIFCFTTGQKVSFPAFVTDFGDSFKVDLSNTQVYGRMDPIITYKNTTRTVTLAFDVPSESLEESKKLIEKIKDKLKKYRTRGLEKGGEYSDENLVFKVLRRNGYIGKLLKLKTDIIDKKLSITQ